MSLIRGAMVLAVATGLAGCFPYAAQPAPQGTYQGAPAQSSGAYGESSPSSYGSSGAPASSYGAPATSSAPAAPSSVSVRIRSSCSKTVKVFFGDKPKYGSGRYSSISSNSVQSETFQNGGMVWIVDDSENGLSSTSVGPGTSEIEILSSCTGFRVR